MKDTRGDLLTRTDLQNLDTLQEAISSLRECRKEYTFDRYEQVRLAALPFSGPRVRNLVERFFPDWKEHLHWTLLLECRSFMYHFIIARSLFFPALMRAILALVADRYLHVPRFHMLANLHQALISPFKMSATK